MKLSIWHLKTQRHYDIVVPPAAKFNEILFQKLSEETSFNSVVHGEMNDFAPETGEDQLM